MNANKNKFVSGHIKATLEELKPIARWGTNGKNGKKSLRWVRLINCSTAHLNAILRTQPFIGPLYLEIIQSILADRADAKLSKKGVDKKGTK